MKLFKISKIQFVIQFIFYALLMNSCNQYSAESDLKLSRTNLKMNEKPIDDKEKISLKIIKSAKTKYKVVDVKKATNEIKALAKMYKGYISDLSFQNNLYRIQNDFTIKIPKQNFDVFLDSLHSYVEFIEFENITTRDVSEQYFDASSRLRTKIEVKERYESILRKKAKTVDEVLNTEEKLRIIQEEIEATKGKLNYLKNRIAFSTIEIELYQVVEYQQPEMYQKSFLSKTKESFIAGSRIITAIFLGLVNVWPLLIVVILVFLVYKKRKK